jgi:hypothetical protein
MPNPISNSFNHLRSAVVALSGIFLLSGCAASWKRQPAANGFGAELEGSLRYGPISGYLQTPNGGAPGTTSSKRPTFQELNIDDFLSPDASLHLRWNDHAFYGGASLVRLDGDSTLDTALISHGTTFPAGTAVQSAVQMDSYRLGYQYRFTWANERGTTLSIAPAAGIALLNFDYSLKGGGGLTANRGYLVGSPQLGLNAGWSPPGRFSVDGGIFNSLPEVGNLFILSAQVRGSYRLWGQGERGGRVFLGVGYDWVDYQDGQQVPNHIQAKFGPMLLFGIGTRF